MPQIPGPGHRLLSLLQSHLAVILILAVFTPLWVTTRISSLIQTIRRPSAFMASTDMFLGAAAAPIKLFPWYYDVKARQAFLAKNDPLAEWEPGDYAKAAYNHVPAWEPGLAIPLRLCRVLFNTPVSLPTLISCQLGMDILVLIILGVLCFEIGGFVGSTLGVFTYAGWMEVAMACTFPFYYYWPVPFSIVLIGLLVLLNMQTGGRMWLLIALAIGADVGLWCWFRGTAVSVLLAVPFLILLVVPSRRKALYAGAAAMIMIALVLLPSAIHNWPRSHSIMPRGQIWHDMYVGIGTRANPYGIIHWDGYAASVVYDKYGIPFQGPGYEEALRKEYLAVLVKDPLLIGRNFSLNLFDGLKGWSFTRDPLKMHGAFWFLGLLGVTILIYKRDRRWRWLGAACAVWLIQCATVASVKVPGTSYLWETLGTSVLCGAAGAGVSFEAVVRLVRSRVRDDGFG